MDKEELSRVLESHRKWFNEEVGGVRAVLRDANLRGANLLDADLRGAKTTELQRAQLIIVPEEGEFIGWKQAKYVDDTGFIDCCIVKLRITADAKRSNATTRKCRCSKAEILEIQDYNGDKLPGVIAFSVYDNSFKYYPGATVSINNFDDDRWSECAAGIHFFITREEAINY